jgi:DNA-binding NarL/FixJ family response regulator
MIASSFFNALSRAFTVLGRYSEALPLAHRSIELANRTKLRFALPHALISKAIALLGLRDYGGVEETLREAERLAASINDRHNIVDARAVRSRLALSLCDADAAISATENPPYGVIDGMRAEYVATRALAFACAGRITEAEYTLETLVEVSTHPDASAVCLTARAVIAAHRHELTSVREQLHELSRLGIRDPLIIARRGSTQLSTALAELDDPMLRAFAAAESEPNRLSILDTLTTRELEVLRLLTRGRTNREIAEELVIAEVTAKVHVRHILKKLSVRSRTEAAVLTTTLAHASGATGQSDLVGDA